MNVGPAKEWGHWEPWGTSRSLEVRYQPIDPGDADYVQIYCSICDTTLTVGYPMRLAETTLFGRFIQDHVHTGQMMLPWGVR